MVTILNKIFFGAAFIFLSWKGLDGLIINVLYNSQTSVDIRELETTDEFEARYLLILNGLAGKGFVYFEPDDFSPVDIVYPLISYDQKLKLSMSEPVKIRVLVRLNNQNRNCLLQGGCTIPDSVSVGGVVKVGLENLRSQEFRALESELIRLDENVILVEPGDEPIFWYWNLLMFVGGTVFAFTILKSFFRKASSFNEYWEKITEKPQD